MIMMSPETDAPGATDARWAKVPRRVVFPEPLGPIMASISPAQTKPEELLRIGNGLPVL